MTATVLVVDDEPDIRLLVSLILEEHDLNVLEASSGEQALELLREQRPDVVLLDLRLPGLDGWEVMAAVHDRDDGDDVPIVVMSAHSSGHTMEQALHRGAQAYLVKPFRQQELLDVVDRFIAKR